MLQLLPRTLQRFGGCDCNICNPIYWLTRSSSLRLRGYLTVYVNLCWAIGQLIIAGVLRGFADDTTQWAYRIPFGFQWAWPIPLFVILWFAPESPWWLVRKGRKQEALVSIQRLSSTRSAAPPESTLALIEHTNLIESEDVANKRSTSYLDCFRSIDLRRTKIACMAFAAQIWCGSPLGGTPVYFFVQAGLSSSNAFSFNVGGLGIAALGTILSWGLLSRFGRRTLYLWGLGGLSLCLYIVGIMSAVSNAQASSFAQAGMIIVWLAIYCLTVGSICYAIISEVSAVRLRNQTICLARMTYYIFQVTGNIIHPYMVNPTEANWKGKAGFFWSSTCALFFIWAFFRLPESKDRSFEEMDILFKERIDARNFTNVVVDPYAAQGQRTTFEK